MLLRALPAAAVLLACVLSGCGGSDGARARVVPVKGRVLFKDEGMTAGEIFFLGDEKKGTQGVMAQAVLQEDGSFTMETYKAGTGVPPGNYKVTISSGRRPEKELVKFRNVKTTPLEIEVPDAGLPNLVLRLEEYPDKGEAKEPKEPKEIKK
jgi:hypothetical protein